MRLGLILLILLTLASGCSPGAITDADAPQTGDLQPGPTPPIQFADFPRPTPHPDAIAPENLAELGEVLRLGNGTVAQVAWALDGRQLVLAGERGG